MANHFTESFMPVPIRNEQGKEIGRMNVAHHKTKNVILENGQPVVAFVFEFGYPKLKSIEYVSSKQFAASEQSELQQLGDSSFYYTYADLKRLVA